MSMYEKKHALYLEYVREQESVLRITEPVPEATIWLVCESYINSKDYKWINLFDEDNEVCGFVIIDKTYALSNKHTVLVQQAYIYPEKRKCGIVREAINNYISEHSEQYKNYHIAENQIIDDFCPAKFVS